MTNCNEHPKSMLRVERDIFNWITRNHMLNKRNVTIAAYR